MLKNHRKITKPKHIRRILADTINQLMNDSIDPRKALAIGSLCQTMLKTIEASTLEERLEKLERVLDVRDVTPKPFTRDIRRMIGTVKDEARGQGESDEETN
jgi:ribosomal protein S7